MLRTNLSTRPFYNERLVHVIAAAVAVIVAAVLVWEAARIIQLSRASTELTSAIARDRAEADRLSRQAADVRRRLNTSELQAVADRAQQANALIAQRTFSWTAFFNQIEATLPEDVMLTSVRPEIRGGVTRVVMEIVGRQTEDVDAFMNQLEGTGQFRDIIPTQDQTQEDGSHKVVLNGIYTASAPAAKAASAARPGAQP
jgi:Tfp pilus assembly protein PilN